MLVTDHELHTLWGIKSSVTTPATSLLISNDALLLLIMCDRYMEVSLLPFLSL
jgi:hypothetical protein